MTLSKRIARPVLAGSCLVAFATTVSAQSMSPFTTLTFADRKQFTVTCAARYECDIELEEGERVNDGFNAHIDQWDPHVGYSGDKQLTPHLVLRPSRSDLRTNIILTTTKRTYYILAISTSTQQPSYYSFSYADETYKALANLSVATQTALRASGQMPIPEPSATPADVASLASTCFDYDYSYLIDTAVRPDHIPGARPSRERFPDALIPTVACTDGRHTYVQFPIQREVPSDLPVTFSVQSEGDTLINYTYLSNLNRFTIDGVYDSFSMEIGSQSAPVRLRIYHAGHGVPEGRRAPRPIPIVPPAAYVAASETAATPLRAQVPVPPEGAARVASPPGLAPAPAAVDAPSTSATATAAPSFEAPAAVAPPVLEMPVATPTEAASPSPAPTIRRVTPTASPVPPPSPAAAEPTPSDAPSSARPEPSAPAEIIGAPTALPAASAAPSPSTAAPRPRPLPSGTSMSDAVRTAFAPARAKPIGAFDAFLASLPRPEPALDELRRARGSRVEAIFDPSKAYDTAARAVAALARSVTSAAFWRVVDVAPAAAPERYAVRDETTPAPGATSGVAGVR